MVDLPDHGGVSRDAAQHDSLPERTIAVEHAAVGLGGHTTEHLLVAVGGQPDFVDVILDVEVRVVDPQRVGDEERWEHDALAVPGQQVHAGADLLDHVLSGELALVDHAATDVHGLVGALHVEEGGV